MQNEVAVAATSYSDELDFQPSFGNSENWKALSVGGEKPAPRFNVTSFSVALFRPLASELFWINYVEKIQKKLAFMQHAAAAIGNKMIVVGGESSNGLLDDVQV